MKERMREKKESLIIAGVSLIITAVILKAFPMALAVTSSQVASMISAVKLIVRIGASVAGAIYSLIGLVAFIMARAEGEGPEQSKAIRKIEAGLTLIIVAVLIIPNLDIESWIVTS